MPSESRPAPWLRSDQSYRLAREEGRSQAEILREAVATYQPKQSQDRNFSLATGFRRIDGDPGPISEIPDEELLKGFGE